MKSNFRFLGVLWLFLEMFSCSELASNSSQSFFEVSSSSSSLSDEIWVDTLSSNKLETYNKIFDNTKVHILTVEFSSSEWSNLINDFDKSPGHSLNWRYQTSGKSEVKRKVNITFQLNGVSSNVTLDNVGFKMSGNTSRMRPEDNGHYQRFHFVLDFNETFDDNEGYYSGSSDISEITNNKGRKFYGILRALKFKMASADPNLLFENFSYSLFREMGVAAPLTGYAHVFFKIDGQTVDYGIYKEIEPVDKSFLKRVYGSYKGAGSSYGDLYKCLYQSQGPADLKNDYSGKIGMEVTEPTNGQTLFRPSYDLKNHKDVTPPTYQDFKDFVDNLNIRTGSDFASWIEDHFEVDLFLRELAINTLVGMSDDYWVNGNNYYFYQNIQNGKWVFIPYDYDNTFGQLSINGDVKSVSVDAFGPTDGSRPLVNKLMQIAEYKNRYHSYLSNAMRTLFTLSNFNRFSTVKSDFTSFASWGAVDSESIDYSYDFSNYMIIRISNAAVQLGLSPNLFGIKTSTNSNSSSNPFISPEISAYSVIFKFLYDGLELSATNVYVPGSFNSWLGGGSSLDVAYRMTNVVSNYYVLEKPKSEVVSSSEYKFYIEESSDWITDPNNPNVSGDNQNSQVLY